MGVGYRDVENMTEHRRELLNATERDRSLPPAWARDREKFADKRAEPEESNR